MISISYQIHQIHQIHHHGQKLTIWATELLKYQKFSLLFLELATFKIFELWEKWDVLIELHDISVIWSEFRIFRRNNLFWRLNFIFNHNEQMWFFDDAKTGK